jgi:DNA-binding CsgD family transcriptional regulator
MQIIKLILSGNSNREIAGKLGIAVRTVETHITNIYGKLGLKNRNELINYYSGTVTQQPAV